MNTPKSPRSRLQCYLLCGLSGYKGHLVLGCTAREHSNHTLKRLVRSPQLIESSAFRADHASGWSFVNFPQLSDSLPSRLAIE
jgi:hypothetical protein